ncbi:unnamed protein product [Medioppia subpectinata]|uniref:NR LBD domain-containing protein n=1 Tax=Medioppia subpectinata TaxID=1979941 RepID=A0A7R9PZM1_9ACAR|nr:unnamed protein product [Medioppia subpectinata]CAG2106609.1 unnamed protein product [Medioppia subpectinata]
MVKMCSKINGFNELCEDDKIALLKTACPQLMILLSVILFDFEGQFWTIPIDEEKATILPMSVLKTWSEIVVEIQKKFIGLIFNFNELEINRFKELFNSVAVVRNPTVRSIAYETVNVREALELLLNGANVMFSRMVKMSLKISGFTDLCEDDKIVLLKAACPQLTILQSIIIFNFNGEFWTIPIIY